MEQIIRGSEYQSFLNCRKQWFYQWVEGIEAKKPDRKLFFGNAFHKWLEEYYNSGCDKLHADLAASVWINMQDTEDMQQTDLDDVMTLLKKVAEYYHETYYNNDSKWNVLGTEVEFIVKLDKGLYYTGTIDLIYEVDGKVRFADHKTVASLGMYEEKSKMDRQISRYWWVMKQLALGVALIKDKETNGYVEFTKLKGKEIDGFDYNLVGKDYPKEPKVLKSGKLSTDKSQRTTYSKYYDKIVELGLNPADYEDMLEMLKEKPDPFLKRINVIRTEQELEAAMWEFTYTASDMGIVRDIIATGIAPVESATYRNIGTHCETMCQFRSLCATEIEGGNVSMIKNLGYKKREENK